VPQRPRLPRRCGRLPAEQPERPDGLRELRSRRPAGGRRVITAPSANAPLVHDPGLPGSGTTRANDWGDKAVTGQSFAVTDRSGDWTAIWYGGQKAWFADPKGANTVPGSGTLVTPKAGRGSIPVYGRAYPSWPSATLQYTIPAGQVYVAKDFMPGSFYDASIFNAPDTYSVEIDPSVHYYEISFNHRLAFVRARDVDVLP
jgi:hypothetical protein